MKMKKMSKKVNIEATNEHPAIRECKYEECSKLFSPPRNNLGQEYCSIRCWQIAHNIGNK